MISRETAVAQIKRLSRLRNAPDPMDPDDKPAIDEIIKALMRTADDELHAFDIVSEIIEKSQFFPVPSDIYGQRREKPWSASYTRCTECSDTGWVHVDDGGQGSAKRCKCRPLAVPAQGKPERGGMARVGDMGRFNR